MRQIRILRAKPSGVAMHMRMQFEDEFRNLEPNVDYKFEDVTGIGDTSGWCTFTISIANLEYPQVDFAEHWIDGYIQGSQKINDVTLDSP